MEEKKEKMKIIVFIEKDGSILVKNYDDMLQLLDEGWEVKEEYSGDIFIMTKKKTETEDPSKNLKARDNFNG